MSERIFTLPELAFSAIARREYRLANPEEWASWNDRLMKDAQARYRASNQERLNALSRERVREWTARPGNQERKNAWHRNRRAKIRAGAASISPAQDRQAPPTGGVSRINKIRDALKPVSISPTQTLGHASRGGLAANEQNKLLSGPVCFMCGQPRPFVDGQKVCAECFEECVRLKSGA